MDKLLSCMSCVHCNAFILHRSYSLHTAFLVYRLTVNTPHEEGCH